jgi:hypothetical protein
VQYTEQTIVEPQGPVRVHVLAVDLTQHGVTFDQVSSSTASARATLSRLVAADKDVAAINGDYFDINRTDAALGVAVDKQRGLLHAPRTGHNNSFVIARTGAAYIRPLHLVASVIRRHKVVSAVDGYNTPWLRAGRVNVYNRLWGTASLRTIVAGAKRVRQVVLVGGVVRSNRTTVRARFGAQGTVLLGRGAGASVLRGLKVGQHVSLRRALDRTATVAIGGGDQILRGGRVTTTDAQLHPRTAVGVSADHQHVWLVVADGRSESSSGVTLVQLAALLRELGSYDGLNLDGGGSSTMVAPDALGLMGLRNSPSDGHERPIANGLVLKLRG